MINKEKSNYTMQDFNELTFERRVQITNVCDRIVIELDEICREARDEMDKSKHKGNYSMIPDRDKYQVYHNAELIKDFYIKLKEYAFRKDMDNKNIINDICFLGDFAINKNGLNTMYFENFSLSDLKNPDYVVSVLEEVHKSFKEDYKKSLQKNVPNPLEVIEVYKVGTALRNYKRSIENLANKDDMPVLQKKKKIS